MGSLEPCSPALRRTHTGQSKSECVSVWQRMWTAPHRQSHMAFLWLDFDRLFHPSSDIFNIFIDIYYLLILLLSLCTELLSGRGVKHNLVFMWCIKMTIQGSTHQSMRTVAIHVWPPNPYQLEEVNFGTVQLFKHEYKHGNATWT